MDSGTGIFRGMVEQQGGSNETLTVGLLCMVGLNIFIFQF